MNLKLKALIVDDSRVMRNMVMESLKKTGLAEFTFVEAEDGQDALNKLPQHDIHIAFVDWNMPNMTGIDFIKAARKLALANEQEPIPMVMVTSEKTMGKVQEAMDEAGAEGFISKPFTPDEMKKKVAKVIDRAVAIQLQRLRKRGGSGVATAAAEPDSAQAAGSFFGRLFN